MQHELDQAAPRPPGADRDHRADIEERPRRRYRMGVRADQQARLRRRILDVMKEAVVVKPYPAIRIADVAADAGVSAPTVHHHFSSKEALFLAAMAELGPEALALRGRPAPGDVPAIVAGLVRGYERYGDANWRLLPQEQESEAVATALATGRQGHRAWLEEVFRPALPSAGARRRDVLDALYAATDVGTWKVLRRDLGLSRARTTVVLEGLVHGALAQFNASKE